MIRVVSESACALVLLLLGTVDASVFVGQQGQVTFRSGVDLVQVSFQVYDQDHHAVRGLTADDFEVRVDDAIETIAAFSELDAPPLQHDTGAAWSRDAPPDVASNEGADRDGRLWAIIMDDCSTKNAALAVPFMVPNAKAVARALVNSMSMFDRTAIVFSWNSRNAQDFTASRSKLLAAIETFTPAPASAMCRPQNTIRSVATFLQELGNPRSAIVYLGLPPTVGANAAAPSIPLLTRTPVYGFDIAAILAGPASVDVHDALALKQMILASAEQQRHGFLQSLADIFGGVAIPETNEPVREISRILDDLSVTYVLAYQPTYPPTDGRYRRIHIRAKRSGLTVEPSDRIFKTEKAADPSKPVAAWVSLTNALSGILPDSAAPLRVNVLPIAADGIKGESSVAVVLGAIVPADAVRLKQSVNILSMVFDKEGRRVSSQEVHAEVPGSPTERAYDFLSLQSLKPGRYDVRFALQDASSNVVGSVYADVTVPAFAEEPLSVSGLAISATPAPVAAPRDAVAHVLPIVPTTKREFKPSDHVSSFVRVFQGGKKAVTSVSLQVKIQDEQGKVAWSSDETIDAGKFDGRRSTDWEGSIPVASLEPGRYLYSVEVTAGQRKVTREAIFGIR